MSEPNQVIVFGDQTCSFDGGIRQFSQRKENANLISFFERCYFALRQETAKLPLAQRSLFPRFTSVLDLLARYRKYSNNPALESALTCIHQLANFISYYGEASYEYPIHSNTRIIGLCTGLITAAAISSSTAVVDLIPAGVEAVLIAFRTGLATMKARDSICQKVLAAGSWSVVVFEVEEAAALVSLKEFSHSKGIPLLSQPFVSATSANSLTISGPPQILEQVLRTSPFTGRRSTRLPIHSPYHAPHIYNEAVLNEILAPTDLSSLSKRSSRIPIISSSTGRIVQADDFSSALHVALKEILLEPLRAGNFFDACISFFKSLPTSPCWLVPFATSVTQSVVSMLKQVSDLDVRIQQTQKPVAEWNTLSTGRPAQSKIAIVGLSGRFPDAEDPDHLWDLLFRGLDVHRKIPKDRFNIETHYDPTGKRKNTTQVPYGCFIENPGLFDARFFNISPREAAQADPAQRLALVTAYEALEMAGFVPDRTPSSQRDRVGIFYGMTSDDWREVNSGQNVDTYFIPGGNRAFTPGRINYHFKFSGPSISVDTACSSSLAAIHTACNALWQGDCDTALAGGTNVLTNPDNFVGLDKGHFLSRTGNCKTFDDGADGYCRSDAVGTVVLKRLEDAEADRDPIQGVILGACTNHSAEAVSITRPEIGAQSFVFDKVLNAANVDPNDVSFIEMHGTGTQAGDAVEMSSCLDIFAPDVRTRRSPLFLGSVKANVGHAESASGVTSLIKVMLMMRESTIPPHCGIKTKINHTFPTDLQQRDVHIAFKPTPWTRGAGEKRKAFLNNFSAAGGNTALLLEDAPEMQYEGTDPRPVHMVAISARSKTSLQKNAQALIRFIDKRQECMPASLSYTTTARRMHHNYRLMVSGTSLSGITEQLKALLASDGDVTPIPQASRRIVFAFTGQGSQYIGMGKQLFEKFSQFRNHVKQLDAIVQRQGFATVIPIIDGSANVTEPTEPTDLPTVDAQLATVCLQIALVGLWSSWGISPDLVVGHSLGEYAALNAAGVLSTADTIYLVGKRAQLLAEDCAMGTHGMLAIKASASGVQGYVEDYKCEIACINAPEETVVSGTNGDIDILARDLTSRGVKCTALRVPFAFHSAQVDPILDKYSVIAQGVMFNKPTVSVISSLLEDIVTEDGKFGSEYLRRHCREPVNFLGGLEAARDARLFAETDISIEIGPHAICSGMIKATFGSKLCAQPSLRRSEDTWKTIVGSLSSLYLAGANIRWTEYHRDFEASLEVLPLPAYAWDNKNHWIDYVHDWCLSKGDPPVTLVKQPHPPKLSTTSVQNLVEETVGKDGASVIFESDISRPALNAVFQGHKVHENPMCPSSLYIDMVLTIGDYLVSSHNPESNLTAMDVRNMTVTKPLIADATKKVQLLRVSASVSWISQSATFKFYTVSLDGIKIADHAHCELKYGNGTEWKAEWQRNAYMVKSRLDQLEEDVMRGPSHKMKRGMAYRLFSSMVEYSNNFKGFEEVTLNSTALEATAKVKFQTTADDGDFFMAPYWVDSLGQLSGFVMNANDAVDQKTTAYVNHGWDSVRHADVKSFSTSKTYQTYVKMQPHEKAMHVGDVYIFDENTVVAVYSGVKFQGVPRKLFDTMLPSPKGTAGLKPLPRATQPPASAFKSLATHRTESPVKTVRAATSSQRPSIVDQALKILAEEIGVTVQELSDESEFADLGVDSLLSLTLSSKLREELNLQVESSDFIEYSTVKSMKSFISKSRPAEPLTPESSGEESDESGMETPETCATSVDSVDNFNTDGLAKSLRAIIANEVGVAVADLSDDTDLLELGMDSLMSLTITGRMREELNMEFPVDLVGDKHTLGAVEEALHLQPDSRKEVAHQPKPPTAPKSATPLKSNEIPSATSVLLQGNPKTASKILWLFPDGSGSATSYSPLPIVGNGVAVYALNCPYMKTPEDFKCSLEDITNPYLAEIRRRQPHGPYHFGGWSAGGISAYDAAQRLIKDDEQVKRLILIDSPNPIGLEKLPPRLYEFFKSIGMFGPRGPPDWLIAHFLAFVDSLDKYRPVPFMAGKAPKTHMIWAEDGVCKHPNSPRPDPQDDDPREMRWLLENRTDFGPNGWDTLLDGRKDLVIETLKDANHFSMMEGENVQRVRAFVARAMA